MMDRQPAFYKQERCQCESLSALCPNVMPWDSQEPSVDRRWVPAGGQAARAWRFTKERDPRDWKPFSEKLEFNLSPENEDNPVRSPRQAWTVPPPVTCHRC